MNSELLELQQLRKELDDKLRDRAHAKAERRAANAAVDAAAENLAAVQAAVGVAQHVAQQVQEHAHQQIAAVVSRALAAVFEEPYTFKVVFDQKRGRTEASLVFTKDGVDIDPMSAAGGGVVDVAAFALRLSSLLLAKPPLRRLLVLDEPLKHLSQEYRARARMLIETLATELGFQIILVTHSEELVAQTGTVIRL